MRSMATGEGGGTIALHIGPTRCKLAAEAVIPPARGAASQPHHRKYE
jgi:hypothetical protein